MKLNVETVTAQPQVGDFWVQHNPLSLIQITHTTSNPYTGDVSYNIWEADKIENCIKIGFEKDNFSRLNYENSIARSSLQVYGNFEFKVGDFWILGSQIIVIVPPTNDDDYIYFMGTEHFDLHTGEIRPFQVQTKNEVLKETVLVMVSQSLEMAVSSTDITFEQITEIWNDFSVKEVMESE